MDLTCFKWCDTTNISQFREQTGCWRWERERLRMYTVVQCIVGCILYNGQIVWPWTLCFPFINSTDCSIDFDWLQVHINKEQELQYHRDKGLTKFVRCRVQDCKNRGTRRRKNRKQNYKEQSRVVISDQFWATMIEHVFRSSKDNDGKIWIFF